MGALGRRGPGRLIFALARLTLAALAALLLGVGTAWAHPQLVRMEPAEDAQLDAPPARLRITFNEPLEAISSLALRDARGHEVAAGGAPLADDPNTLGLDLPALDAGVYTMLWTVIGDDGHIVKGNASFTVLRGGAAAPAAPGPAAARPAPAPAPPSAGPGWAAILLRGLMLIGAAAGVGGLAFLAGLLGPALADAGAQGADLRRARAWLAAPLLLCAAAAILMLIVQSQQALGRLDTSVLQTRYGGLLAARAALAALLALVLTTDHRPPTSTQPTAAAAGTPTTAARRPTAVVKHLSVVGRRSSVVTLLGLLLLLTFSLGGHPAAAASPLLPVLADSIHLGVTALWVGGLLIFGLSLPAALRRTPEDRRPGLLRAVFRRFSALALASVTLLTLTGAYAALRALGSLADLWTTAYGLALLAKLLVFGAMIGFGAYHLLVARPGLEEWALRAIQRRPWPRLLGRSLRAEAALGLLALLAAGALTSLAPPVDGAIARAAPFVAPTPTAIQVPTATPGPTRTPVPSVPFDQAQTVKDLRVRLQVDPASIGDDRFVVTVTDLNGGPVATQLVRLKFEMLTMDMGQNQLVATPAAAASYTVSGAPLSMVGDWQITVTVRRAGLRDVLAVFRVPVGE